MHLASRNRTLRIEQVEEWEDGSHRSTRRTAESPWSQGNQDRAIAAVGELLPDLSESRRWAVVTAVIGAWEGR